MNHAIRNMAYEFRRKYGKVFTALYLSSLLLYLPFLILRLTNDMDGMWDQDDHITGTAELRMGRWFWPILDKLRLNVSLDPLPALISLAVFSCGVIFLLSLMNVRTESRREQLFAWTIGMMILASPTVLCQLSYSHMAINDAVSFLLAVLAVWLLRKRKRGWGEILLSGLMIALMMGGYQATLGVTCVTALLAFVRMLQQREQVRNALAFAGRMLLAILLGAVLYEVFLHLGLVLTGQTLSEDLFQVLKRFTVSINTFNQALVITWFHHLDQQANPEVKDLLNAVKKIDAHAIERVCQRAQQRGELRTGTLSCDLQLMPFDWLRYRAFANEPITDATLHLLVDDLLVPAYQHALG